MLLGVVLVADVISRCCVVGRLGGGGVRGGGRGVRGDRGSDGGRVLRLHVETRLLAQIWEW